MSDISARRGLPGLSYPGEYLRRLSAVLTNALSGGAVHVRSAGSAPAHELKPAAAGDAEHDLAESGLATYVEQEEILVG